MRLDWIYLYFYPLLLFKFIFDLIENILLFLTEASLVDGAVILLLED